MPRRDPDAVRPPDLSLSGLPIAAADDWGTDPVHDGMEFAGLELATYDAGNTRFVECRISAGRFGQLTLRRSRFIASEMVDAQATSLDVAESEWTDVGIRGGRFGALLAPGSSWTRVALTGVRSNYVNLRGCTIVDLTLTDCRIEELDLGTASLERAVFSGEFERLVLTGSSGRAVDLRGAEIGEIEGVAELRGSTITPYQLTRLAPALAAQLGIRVLD